MSDNFWFGFCDTLLMCGYSEKGVLKAVKRVAWMIEVLKNTEPVGFPFWQYRRTP